MNFNIKLLEDNLCRAMCAEVRLRKKSDDLYIIDTPFYFSDGDAYQLFLMEAPEGMIKITDNGHTLIHLSYENDVNSFKEGTRGMLYDQILSELEVKEDNGELLITTTLDKLVNAIFRMSKAITQITDLTFLNRLHAKNTFYEDLEKMLYSYVDQNLIEKDFIHPDLPAGKDYPIDYFIRTNRDPLVVFGIGNKDKARLATIILERLNGNNIRFESLLVYNDLTEIPKADIARLLNIGGDTISSLDASEDFKRKVLRRVQQN